MAPMADDRSPDWIAAPDRGGPRVGRERDTALRRAARLRRQKAGRCRDCWRKVEGGGTRCPEHAAANREAVARHRARRRREEGGA